MPPGESPEQKARALEQAVLARIAPDAATERRLAAATASLVARAESVARERAMPLRRALVAGSAARGTYLRDRMDIDLFLLFPPETSRAELQRMGLELGGAVLTRPETRYAEHPYLRGTFDGFSVDAVPGFAVEDSSKPLSAVDRTPFHQAYLMARHTPETVAQVRLAKQFLRSLGVYGSEAKTGGLSGYLVELLVLRFGSLDGLLHAAAGWRIPVRLVTTTGSDPTVPEDVALVLDDPVDPGRNVATALTRRNLGLLILASAEYLARPSAAAFELPPAPHLDRASAQTLATERGTHVVVVGLPRPNLVDDILYPQLRKAERAIGQEAARLGFTVIGTGAAAGPQRLVVAVEVGHASVPAVKWQDGPPPGIDRAGSFLEKWAAHGSQVLQGPYVGPDGKLAVETRRPERHLEPQVRAALERLPLGRDLKEAALTATVHPLSAETDDPALTTALAELLGKRLPWLPRP